MAVRSAALSASERVQLFDNLRKHDFEMVAHLLPYVFGGFLNRRLDARLNDDLDLVGEPLRELAAHFFFLDSGVQRFHVVVNGGRAGRIVAGDDDVVKQRNRVLGVGLRGLWRIPGRLSGLGPAAPALLEDLFEPTESFAQRLLRRSLVHGLVDAPIDGIARLLR
jgi:hypothetical protein